MTGIFRSTTNPLALFTLSREFAGAPFAEHDWFVGIELRKLAITYLIPKRLDFDIDPPTGPPDTDTDGLPDP